MSPSALRRTGLRSWEAGSRTRNEPRKHRIHVGIDGVVLCDCEAGMNNRKCWAVKAVREEMDMNETMTRELVPIKTTPPVAALPTVQELTAMERAARLIMKGAITLPEGVRTPEQATAMIMYGWEMGLKPMTAMTQLYVVKGKVQPSAQVMLGVAQAREADIRMQIIELTTETCTLRLLRPSRGIDETYTVPWSDIEKAGLARDENLKYPKDRMTYHATKRLMRLYCPDLIHGIEGLTLPAAVNEDDIDESDLWNPGDATEGEYRVVANDITAETKQALQNAYQAAVASLGKEPAKALRAELAKRWPSCFQQTVTKLDALSEDEAQACIAFLPKPPATEESKEEPPATVCDHDPTFNEDTTLTVCSKCGTVLDGPPAESQAPASPQAGLGV